MCTICQKRVGLFLDKALYKFVMLCYGTLKVLEELFEELIEVMFHRYMETFLAGSNLKR